MRKGSAVRMATSNFQSRRGGSGKLINERLHRRLWSGAAGQADGQNINILEESASRDKEISRDACRIQRPVHLQIGRSAHADHIVLNNEGVATVRGECREPDC